MSLPIELRPFAGEAIEQYVARVGPLFPQIPIDILETWFFEHFHDVSTRWGWLPIDRMTFQKKTWDTGRILNDVTAWNEPMIEAEKKKILSSRVYQEEPLVAYMIETGTWPSAPLLLVGDGDLVTPDGELVPPYWLIEGHHRLGGLHALTTHAEWSPLNRHDVWLLEIDES